MASKCNALFESAASSATSTSIPNFALLGVSIMLIIMSALQAYPTENFEIDDTADTWFNEICPNSVVQYLSPFHFESSETASCPWRPRNTILRIIVSSVAVVTSILVCVLLCVPSASSKLSSMGLLLGWLNWLVFVMMFVVFVLDCDCINTGYSVCKSDFKLGDYSLFSFYEASTYDFYDFLSDQESIDEYEIETCLITPFVWTALLDLLASFIAFCAYKMCTHFIQNGGKTGGGSGTKASRTDTGVSTVSPAASAGTVASGGAVSQMSPSNAVPAAGAVGGKKEDSPDPFATFQGGYEVDEDGARKGTAASAPYNGTSAYDE